MNFSIVWETGYSIHELHRVDNWKCNVDVEKHGCNPEEGKGEGNVNPFHCHLPKPYNSKDYNREGCQTEQSCYRSRPKHPNLQGTHDTCWLRNVAQRKDNGNAASEKTNCGHNEPSCKQIDEEDTNDLWHWGGKSDCHCSQQHKPSYCNQEEEHTEHVACKEGRLQ